MLIMIRLCLVSVIIAIAAPGCDSLDFAAISDLGGDATVDGEGPDGIDDGVDADIPDSGSDGTGDDGGVTDGNGGQDIDSVGGDDVGDVVDPDVGDDTTDDNGDDTTDGLDANVEVMDFSAFQQFSFSRTPALGFCPPLDAVYSASIFVNFDDSFELNMSILREGVVGQDSCIGNLVVPCAAATQMEARTLTAVEAASIVTAFSQVQVDDDWDPVCDEIAIDPCVINQFSWDTFFGTDFECSAPRLLPDQARTLINLLEGLRN